MMVRYTGPALDYSGYGEANRHDIAALLSAGVGVSVELTRHCLELSDFGELGQTIMGLQNQPSETARVKILHTTPNIYGQFIEPGKYHVGRVFWETNKLPPDFARGCNMVNEIWTGSQYNADAIRRAGVSEKIPIYVIPESIQPIDQVEPFKCDVKSEKAYTFYSIFEWTERKNPEALLEAYFREFQGQSDVALVIKTYVDNFSSAKRREIDDQIAKIKNRLMLKSYPDVYLFRHLLDREQMYRFHQTFDCFVSAHRGEGWGIPQMEAMALGKTVISTACGGIHEHVFAEECYTVPYKLVQLKSNSRNAQWYTDDQQWAEVDLQALRICMRDAYEHRKTSPKGDMAKQAVVDRFYPEVVGKLMRERIEKIEASL
jgi:glycosyltransferase involved in cell wall biosynthesis